MKLLTPINRLRRLRLPVGAFEYRNFRIFWAGAFVSQVGNWMQIVAQGWLIFELTNSPFWLGLDVFAATAPGLLLTLAGGVFADTFDRRRMLLLTQAFSGLFALVLALLITADAVRAWMLLALSFGTGSCLALASPAWQAFLINLVEKQHVGSAIALNSVQYQLSRVLGPVLAGLTFKIMGVAGCYFLNALSYVVLVAALMLVRFETTSAQPTSGKSRRMLWQDFVDGFNYARRHSQVFILLLNTFVISLFSAPYYSMIPVFARDVLHLNESGLALLMGMSGVGAVCGALALALLSGLNRTGWFWIGGACVFSLCLIGFAYSTHLNLSLVFLFCLGFSITCYSASANTLLQKSLPDQMRGRVASMYIIGILGGLLVGSLASGYVATLFGISNILALCGLVTIIYVPLMTLWNNSLRALLFSSETVEQP